MATELIPVLDTFLTGNDPSTPLQVPGALQIGAKGLADVMQSGVDLNINKMKKAKKLEEVAQAFANSPLQAALGGLPGMGEIGKQAPAPQRRFSVR